MAVQNVSNTPMGSYPVLVDKNTGGAGIQVVRLDLGVGTSEDRLTNANGIATYPVSGVFIQRYDYSNSSTIYVGTAPKGSLESASVWTITKYDLTDSSDASALTAKNVAWDDRTTETYN